MERISSESSSLEPSLDNSNAELYRRELIKIRNQLNSAPEANSPMAHLVRG